MGNRDHYHWDDEKSETARIEHGVDLAEICDLVFFTESTRWDVFENPRYPDQYRIVAKTKKLGFITVPMEDKSDDYGTFIKIITWWPSSPNEKRKFNNG